MKNNKKRVKSFFSSLTNGADGSPIDVIKQIISIIKEMSKAISRAINSSIISREKRKNGEYNDSDEYKNNENGGE